MNVLGWDIGGSNTKICRVVDGQVVTALSRPFEIKDQPDRLPVLMRTLAAEAAGDTAIDAHAVTMTAELSRNFLTKREGVTFVLDAAEAALGGGCVLVFTTDGVFTTPDAARRETLRVAAANWMATATLVARTHPDAVLIDIGSTTTDVIPIVAGRVAAEGRTDPERLASGELLYTGAVRTPVEALAMDVCVQGRRYALAAEGFATSGDVHLWRGDLEPGDVAGLTAGGHPATSASAGDRLARALCSDRELMSDTSVTALADALAAAQADRVAAAIRRVVSRHPSIHRAVVAGAGAFIARRAARVVNLEVVELSDAHGDAASRCAPAAAVALLLETQLAIATVVKVGGSLLAHEDALRAVLGVIDRTAGALVVPGGGPFADAVRDADRRLGLGDTAAHWMAVMAMDQYAELLVARLSRGERVTSVLEARAAVAAGRVPVLAPSRWLREADPLPHSWDVTSDSIAAWVAGQVGASTLVLVKAPGATGSLTDAFFARALPPGVTSQIVDAADQGGLKAALYTGT
jgi:(4-(4-[2-(gamma-L-glutamylamino)ethyl]phenoxymethyl)furan-2-yl)methanamine synthase